MYQIARRSEYAFAFYSNFCKCAKTRRKKNATLISTNLETHSSVLQEIDKKAADLDLTLKPSKCVSFLFDGSKHLSQRIPLSGGTTKLITEGGTKFLGKLILLMCLCQLPNLLQTRI